MVSLNMNIVLSLLIANLCSHVTVFGFLIPDGITKVNTRYGEIVGFLDQANFDGKTYQVRKFLGIPYAEPPVGNLRFKKPVMKTRLDTPFQAQQFGATCPQVTAADVKMSEDCLFLNIFAPANENIGSGLKPVMIWVHGGGFVIGSSNKYESDVISAYNDVIVVTMNYRLGVLGFFSTHDENAKGNFGLWDQHLAFRWVYENIGSFGGDNANMTIFGESAGSSSVIYQMLYPGNEGLFKRVIAQSGSIAAFAVSNSNTNYKSSVLFGQKLGCNATQHTKLVECMQSKTENDIIAALVSLQNTTYNEVNVSWVPVFDDEFVPAKTTDILKQLSDPRFHAKYQTFRSFDLLIGVDNFDGLVYFSSLLPDIKSSNSKEDNSTSPYQEFGEHLTDFVIPRSLNAHLGEYPSLIAKQLTLREYVNWTNPRDNVARTISAARIYNDYVFKVPTIVTTRGHLNDKSSTYLYQFSNPPPVASIDLPRGLGTRYVTNHGDELWFEFGFQVPEGGIVSQSEMNKRLSPDDIRLSKAYMTFLTNFAKSGNPNFPNSIQPLYDVTWPQYDATDEYYLEINDQMTSASVKRRLAAKAVEFWNEILPQYTSSCCNETRSSA